jgi:hypothetical protein
MDPTDSNLDLELIAALIDGRLSGEERARAVKLLADSDEALELFASTLRQQQDAADVKVVPIATARRWRQWKVMVPVAAAAVLAILPTLVGRGAQAVLASEYAMALTQDPHFASGLRAGWDQRRWAVTRGGGPLREVPGARQVGSALESRLSFRLGVRSLDLQVALLRGDTALAGRLTSEVLETLSAVAYTDPVAARYTELKSRLATDAVARSIERASDAERELRKLLDAQSFAFGQWVAAAELAAQTHDAAFFQSKHGTRFVRSTIPGGGLAPEDTEALRSIDGRTTQGLTDQALDEMNKDLQKIIRRRGG